MEMIQIQNKNFIKKRLLLTAIFAVIFIASFYAGTEIQVSKSDVKPIVQELTKSISSVKAVNNKLGIFMHNTSIGLPMFVPGFGIVWGIFASVTTGVAFNAVISITPKLAVHSPLELLLASPFGFMELVAYSIGMSRSYLLIVGIIKRQIRNQLKSLLIEVWIVIGLLVVAGLIEYVMIGGTL